MQTAGSGPESPFTAIFATLPVTASGHPGYLGLDPMQHTGGYDATEFQAKAR